MQHLALFSAWATWAKRVAQQRAARALAGQVRTRRLAAALHAWRNCAARQAAAASMLRVLLLGTLRGTFRGWRAAVQEAEYRRQVGSGRVRGQG